MARLVVIADHLANLFRKACKLGKITELTPPKPDKTSIKRTPRHARPPLPAAGSVEDIDAAWF
jgi:hypothetical protein